MQSSEQEEDLRLLRESARTLFDRAGGSGRSRKLRDAGGEFDPDMVRELGEAGVFGVAVPEEQGGLGMGLAAGGVIAEEVGRVIAPEPVVATIGLGLGLLRRLCPEHPKLEQLIGGEASLAVAWQERGPGGASADATCRYADGKLTGGKAWVVGAGGTQDFLVVAEADGGPVLVLAEASADGLVTTRRAQADGSSLGELSFSGTPAAELACGAAVQGALSEAVADATALAAAELVGLSQRAFEITLDYIKTREQFEADRILPGHPAPRRRPERDVRGRAGRSARSSDADGWRNGRKYPRTSGQPGQGTGGHGRQESHPRRHPAARRGRLHR